MDQSHPKEAPEFWGQLGHLTTQQSEILNHFISEVPPEHIAIAKFTVETIEQVSLRFLRARNFDLAKAKELICECHKRKTEGNAKLYATMKPEDCAKCDINVLKNFYPHTQCGFDRKHHPILFESNGKVNVNAINQILEKERLLAYHWWTMECALDNMFTESQKLLQEQNPNSTEPVIVPISTCAVLDFTGLNSSHVSQKMLDHVKELVSVDNVCYPECLGKMLVINAPWIAVQAWKIVKGWLDPRTQAKVEILGSGPETFKRLNDFISPEYLPREYGGIAPNLYWTKPNTDLVHVPRHGDFSHTIDVPAGKVLFVDSYIHDGSLNMTVASANGETVYLKHTIAVDEKAHHRAERYLYALPAEGEPHTQGEEAHAHDAAGHDRKIKVVWHNPGGWSTRQLIYSFTIADTMVFPDFLDNIRKTSESPRTSTSTADIKLHVEGSHVDESPLKSLDHGTASA